VSISPTSEFELKGGSCTQRPVLKPGETCTVRVAYTPTASGSHRANLSINMKPCKLHECRYAAALVAKTMP
jgi:hypothetical protein